MANYVYSDVTSKQIRLVYLEPAASHNDPLECELRACPRRPRPKCPEYDAVSYVWGGADDEELKPLRVLPHKNQDVERPKILWIKTNLVDALKRTFNPFFPCVESFYLDTHMLTSGVRVSQHQKHESVVV